MFARVSIYEIPGERAHEAVASFKDALETIATARLSADAQRPPADSIRSAISAYPRS